MKFFKRWAKIKSSYNNLLFDFGVSPVDVVKYNKKTGFVTWLDSKNIDRNPAYDGPMGIFEDF